MRMNFINLYTLGSLIIANINGGKCWRQLNRPEQEGKLSHLGLCQSSTDNKTGNPSEGPEKLSFSKVVLSKQKIAVCNIPLYCGSVPLNTTKNEWLEVMTQNYLPKRLWWLSGRSSQEFSFILSLALLSAGCVCAHARVCTHACVRVCVPFHPLKRCDFYTANKEFQL